MKYEIQFNSQFKKDLKLAKKQNKDIDKLMSVIEKIARGESLEAKFKDHELKGNLKGCRECHVDPDWLLIYSLHDAILVLLLSRVGSHADLFL